MIKKLKNYLTFKRRMQIEMIETLASICLYLNYDGHHGRNRYAEYMIDHFKELTEMSAYLRSKR